MAFNLLNAPDFDDPLVGFRFGVFFLGGIGIAHPLDFRFKEVSGLDGQLELSPVGDLGQGNSSRQLPNKTKYQNLVLKRGMSNFSTLRMEIQSSLANSRGVARNVLLSILDENGLPVSSWLFSEAYPVRWSLSSLDASSSQVIIETMELTYSKFTSFSL